MYKRFTITANPPKADEYIRDEIKGKARSSMVPKGVNFKMLMASGLCAGLALGWLIKRRNH
jgi:hypothetical protein